MSNHESSIKIPRMHKSGILSPISWRKVIVTLRISMPGHPFRSSKLFDITRVVDDVAIKVRRLKCETDKRIILANGHNKSTCARYTLRAEKMGQFCRLWESQESTQNGIDRFRPGWERREVCRPTAQYEYIIWFLQVLKYFIFLNVSEVIWMFCQNLMN